MTSKSSRIRSNGIYARRAYDGEIVTGFETNGYTHSMAELHHQLDIFQDFAKTQGYEFEQGTGWSNWEFTIRRVI